MDLWRTYIYRYLTLSFVKNFGTFMREKNISHVVVKLLFDNKGLLRYISKLNQAFFPLL